MLKVLFLAAIFFCDSGSAIAQQPISTTGLYGPGIGGDSLGNTALGGLSGGVGNPPYPIKAYIRFRAEQSSPLTSATFAYLGPDNPGYGVGTGGAWKVGLFADDGTTNHFPIGSVLATENVAASAVSDNDKVVTFSAPYATTKGTLYHLIVENTDADTNANGFSINNWVRLSFTEGGALNPRFPASDWGTGYYYSGTWQARLDYAPILSIGYANGNYQGMSYGEASYACPIAPPDPMCFNEKLVGEINGASKMARETFTITGGDKIVSGMGVRLLKTAGTSSDLTISLRDSSDVELDAIVIPANAVATGPAPTYTIPASSDDLGQNARWVSGSFSRAHTLTNGRTYRLRLSSAAGTYWAWVIRRLSAGYAYAAVTAFTDGWAEYTTNGTAWTPLGRVSNESDLQFYLTTYANTDSGDAIKVYNFPNPFDLKPRPTTTIRGANLTIRGTMIRVLPAAGQTDSATLEIYNAAGDRVRRIDLGTPSTDGEYYQNWDGRNERGQDVASGIYWGLVRIGSKSKSFKMALLK